MAIGYAVGEVSVPRSIVNMELRRMWEQLTGMDADAIRAHGLSLIVRCEDSYEDRLGIAIRFKHDSFPGGQIKLYYGHYRTCLVIDDALPYEMLTIWEAMKGMFWALSEPDPIAAWGSYNMTDRVAEAANKG